MSLSLPFSEEKLREIIKEHPTPFHIYDEAGFLSSARKLNEVFDWVKDKNGQGFKNHFAVKATPNPYLLESLRKADNGTDASSLPELIMSDAVGFKGEETMFSSNNTNPEEYVKAYELGAVINLDDYNQIDVLHKALEGRFPGLISFRYNPGPDIVTDESNVIGNPDDAKFGITTEQLPKAYLKAKELGAKRFGLHTMITSNDPDENAHVQTAKLHFKMALELYEKTGIKVEYVNFGGGMGPQYSPNQRLLDLDILKREIKKSYDDLIASSPLHPLGIHAENGRFIMAPNGYLVTTVRSIKETYHRFVGLDATMADLMRPAIYDAYHHVTVLGKDYEETTLQALVGSLCENNDFFTGSKTKYRELPKLEAGDVVIFHTTGAHGHAMGFNYNSKLRHAEYLLKEDGSVKQIRRSETIEDLFKTLDYPGL